MPSLNTNLVPVNVLHKKKTAQYQKKSRLNSTSVLVTWSACGEKVLSNVNNVQTFSTEQTAEKTKTPPADSSVVPELLISCCSFQWQWSVELNKPYSSKIYLILYKKEDIRDSILQEFAFICIKMVH